MGKSTSCAGGGLFYLLPLCHWRLRHPQPQPPPFFTAYDRPSPNYGSRHEATIPTFSIPAFYSPKAEKSRESIVRSTKVDPSFPRGWGSFYMPLQGQFILWTL